MSTIKDKVFENENDIIIGSDTLYNFVNTNQNGIFSFLIFLVSPLLSLLFAFQNLNAKWSKNILWAFIVFFGYTMVVKNEGSDSYEYLQVLKGLYNQSIGINSFLPNIYKTGGSFDVLNPFILSFLALFTDSSKFLFAVYAGIFGFFYSRSIWLLLRSLNFSFKTAEILLLITFVLIVPFWSINGFRFWTASIVFFYAVSHFFLLEKNIKYLVIASITPLIHFSFLIMLLPLFIILLFGNRQKIFFIIFILSIFFIEFDLAFFRDLSITYFPELLYDRVSGYLNEEYALNQAEYLTNINWYASFYGEALNWFSRIVIILIFMSQSYQSNYLLRSFLSFIFLIGSFANIISTVPSGGRFLSIFNLFAIGYIIVNYFNSTRSVKFSISLLSPLVILFIIVSLRVGFDFINITTLFGNPLIALFFENSFALIDFFK